MNKSNRFQLIDRERLYGAHGGIDFGQKVYVIARSPIAMLLWHAGGSYWSGVGQPWAYAASHLVFFYNLGSKKRHTYYRSLDPDGGRLTEKRIRDHAADIADGFEDDSFLDEICEAVKNKQTLLVEGGGSAPRTYANRGW